MEGTTLATKISWCDETINPVVGCSKISAGCQNCYAENMAARLASMGKGQYQSVTSFRRWNGLTAFVPSELDKPAKWQKAKSIFIGSMGDVFHESVDDEDLNSIMEMTMCCPHHTFIFLTKRPQRMFEYFRDFPYGLKNVVLGVSIEDQQTADERIPVLLATPAAKRFISLEPMVGPVNLNSIYEPLENGGRWESCLDGKRFDPWSDGSIDGFAKLDGVILGGESGNKGRPLNPEWIRQVRDQCAAAHVPFMFKQWGSLLEKRGYPIDGGDGLPVFDGAVHWQLPWTVNESI